MYLKATRREELADLADQYAEHLRNDPEVDDDPERFYDRVIDIDLSELEPHLVGPHTPDLDRPISDVREAVKTEGYPAEISYALVGSCTNSSYEDIGRAAHVARQASAAGAAGEDAAAHHARLRAGAGHDRARRPARRPRGDRRDRARQRVRSVHRPVAARRHREGRDATRSSRRSTATSRPATTATRRRCRSSARPRRSPRWRSPAGSTSTSCTSRVEREDGADGAARAAERRRAPVARLRPGRVRVPRRRRATRTRSRSW